LVEVDFLNSNLLKEMEGKMKIRKIFPVLLLSVFLASFSWAGNIPEYDAVYSDADNFFAKTNAPYIAVTNAMVQWYDLERNSNFAPGNNEFFRTTAGQLFDDACWTAFKSALTPTYTASTYEWQIVLQMQPESDINLNIYDCVLKHNEFDLWTAAEQTGRYRAPWGQLFFLPASNPRVTVQMIGGPFKDPGWNGAPILMDTRTMPGLYNLTVNRLLYTSKAHWEEGIVLVMPQTGARGASGQLFYDLHQGDKIYVKVEVPNTNSVDLWYGADNVLLKYIGVIGTWYLD
jgi:hypothetical protein